MSLIKTAILRIKFFYLKLILKRDHYITCSGMTEGAGAQLQAIMSTQLFAKEMGMQYIHTPFQNIYYSEGMENDLEYFFALGFEENSINNTTVREKQIHDIPWRFQKNILYTIPYCHEYADLYPDRYNNIKPDLVKKFNRNKERSEANNIFSVAVHIRRGDVTKTAHPKRYTELDRVKKILNNIDQVLSEHGIHYAIKIVSQGKKEDFTQLQSAHTEFHLNTDLKEAFQDLISSNILVMAKSSMSYSAAILSKATIIYEDFWHKPPSDWIRLPADTFDERLLKEKLKRCLQKQKNL